MVRRAEVRPAAAAVVAAGVGDHQEHSRLVQAGKARARRERHALVALQQVDGVREQSREPELHGAVARERHHLEESTWATVGVARVGGAVAGGHVREELGQDLRQIGETAHLSLRGLALEGLKLLHLAAGRAPS